MFVSERVDKLSPIIVKKPPSIAISSEVKFCDMPIAITLARVTSSQPLKLFKSNIKSPNIVYEVILILLIKNCQVLRNYAKKLSLKMRLLKK